MKIKPMLPTLREKKRYLAYEVVTDKPLGNVSSEIISQVRSTLGIFDSSDAGIVGVEFEGTSGILKTTHTSVDKVRTAMALIKEIAGEPAMVQVTNVSGILKKTRRE